jgi:hypothetical protein
LLSIYELKKSNLLVENSQMDAAMTKFDRRGMIRRLAIGTAFALPVIASLVAPSAAHAASGPLQGLYVELYGRSMAVFLQYCSPTLSSGLCF